MELTGDPPPVPAFLADRVAIQTKRWLNLYDANGECVVSISLENGTVEVGPGYTADTASNEFWAAVRRNF